MKTILQFQQVCFRYTGIGASDGLVLEDINFELRENECVAIVGHSGSGKTTLVQHFTGLLRPVSGRISFCGQDIWAKGCSMSQLRRRIGLVFQFPESQLFEETVLKDVGFGPKNMGFSDDAISQIAREALMAVEIDPDTYGARSPFRLSEGEKRRVAIAGVLALQPDLVVFDEPTAGLDSAGVRKVESLIVKLVQSGKSVVVVTHNMDFAAKVAHRAVVLEKGKIVFDGATMTLFQDGALLSRAGLEVPKMVQVLREMGLDLNDLSHYWTLISQYLTQVRELRNM